MTVFRLLQFSADSVGEVTHFVLRQIQDAAFRTDGFGLLFMVWDAGRAWNDVPMDVAIALLAAKRYQVEPLARDDGPDGFFVLVDDMVRLVSCEHLTNEARTGPCPGDIC